MDKQKQGSGTTRNGSKRSPSDKKSGGSEQPPAEMDMDVLARGLDHVLQKQLDDKLKSGASAEQEAQVDADTAGISEPSHQDDEQVEGVSQQTEVIMVEQVAGHAEEDAGFLASLSVLASIAEEVEQSGGEVAVGEDVAVVAGGESPSVEAETSSEVVVVAESVKAEGSETGQSAGEQSVAVAEAVAEAVEQVEPDVAVADASALAGDLPPALESLQTEAEAPAVESAVVEEAPQAELSVVTEDVPLVIEAATTESTSLAEEAAVSGAEAVVPAVMEPLSGSVVAERKLEMAKLADGFSEMARNKAKMADADSQGEVEEAAVAEPVIQVTEAAEEAELAGTLEVPVVEEAPKPFPHKAPYVAAAEKERVLQMIRDAASKKLDEGYKMRGVQVMAKPEPAPTEPVTESPESAAVEEPVVVVEEESVVVAEAVESAASAVAPEAVTEEGQATTDAIADQPAQEESPAATIVEETVSTAPAPEEEENTVSQPQQAVSADEGDETVQSISPGGLVPPSPRTATPSLRQKQESVPTPNQAKAIEAFLRQLQGEPQPSEDPVVPVSAKTLEEELPELEELEQEQAETAQAAAEAGQQQRSHRRSSRDGDGVVPVESLGTGIYNALGDMVGAVVHTSKRVTGKVKKVVPPPVQEPEEELPPPRPTGTSRAADRLAGGVRGLAGGVTDIVKGSGNVVIGTVGIVVMPVVGAVGELYRAFKPARKDSSTKK
ncbi:MAG: hypothetical protein HQM06_11100 [Magnetococcales bacterium]|nr:hypothetical protein [Magnetococcales bacterium]